MAIPRKKKSAAINRDTYEDQPRINQAQNTVFSRDHEENFSHVSEEVEGRMTKKRSQQVSGTESRIFGALSQLDDFIPNPQARVQFWNPNKENQKTNGDRSQNDPHPEVGVS